MTQEEVNRIIVLHQTIECLEEVKQFLNSRSDHRLSYLEHYFGTSLDRERWEIVDMDKMKYIGDILDRHDGMIREEIDKRIAQYKRELENL